MNKTGDAEGMVTFSIPHWKKDPKIWNHDKMYGVYKDSKGEQVIFRFLELAISDKPITKLEEGLMGRYFIGVGCPDPAVCNFTKASP